MWKAHQSRQGRRHQFLLLVAVLSWMTLVVLLLVLISGCGELAPSAARPTPTATATTPPEGLSGEPQVYLLSDTGVAVYGAADGQPHWSFRLPSPKEHTGTLAVQGGLVYLSATNTLYALSAATGKVLWSTLAGAEIDLLFPTESTLYLASATDLFALDAVTGKVRWRNHLSQAPFQQLVVTATSVYATSLNLVVALDAITGMLRWQYQVADAGVVVDLVPAPEVVLVQTATALLALDSSVGQVRWQVQTTIEHLSLMGERLVMAFLDRPANGGGATKMGLRAVRLADGSLLWEQPTTVLLENDVDAADSTTWYHLLGVNTVTAWDIQVGTLRWKQTGSKAVSSLVADAAHVYTTGSNEVVALSAADGQIAWRTGPDTAAPDRVITTLVLFGATLFGYDSLFDSGSMVAFDAATGQVQWTTQLALHITAFVLA